MRAPLVVVADSMALGPALVATVPAKPPESDEMATTTRARPPTPRTRYEDDLYTWVEEQVALLRAGRLTEIDAENIAEELADVARAEFRALVGAIAIVTEQLLKWDHQPRLRSRSWELSVREHRERIVDALSDNPGMKPRLPDAIARGYKYGRVQALKATSLPDETLPEVCPYSFEEIMTRSIRHVPMSSKRKKKG